MEYSEYSRVVLGYDDIRPSSKFMDTLKLIKPFGVIVFERNILNIETLKNDISLIKEYLPGVLIMIDEEGGVKSRLRKEHGFPTPPNPREAATINSIQETENFYFKAGLALKDIGFDIDLAPVVDIAGEDHILGDRSFSDEMNTCVDYSVAAIKGLLKANICPCAKHFPGLGSATLDPHFYTAVADEKANFESTHFKPFKAAIKSGVPSIMTTHLIARQLDNSGQITTLSSKIISILRDQLAFKGLILSDDLLMKGIAKSMEIPNILDLTLKAGHDLALICREIEDYSEIYEILQKNRDTEVFNRIEKLRKKLLKKY